MADALVFAVIAWLLKHLAGGSSSTSSAPAPKFPPAAPVPAPPAPGAPAIQTPATYTIRSGDTPYGLAQRYAGAGNRWREILSANPSLRTVTRGGVTQIDPWNVGQVIAWPSGWSSPGAGASPGGGGAPRAPAPAPGQPGWVDRRTDQGG